MGILSARIFSKFFGGKINFLTGIWMEKKLDKNLSISINANSMKRGNFDSATGNLMTGITCKFAFKKKTKAKVHSKRFNLLLNKINETLKIWYFHKSQIVF